ncbi:hypothetical protein [Pseudonocardia spinosispora]|uniref:hypothetical protein n=1 Tax=Pseudonocardia spinosispora TaxID=103441 RepID=UPI0003F8A2D8|nr:hypothetical protein [Pseudonocardia spinosispora]
MSIAWGSLLAVLVVSFGAAVAVVTLVAFALVALSGRAQLAGPDARPALLNARTGTLVGGLCLTVAGLIVLYGLYVIVAA